MRSGSTPRGFAPPAVLLALLGGCATVPSNDCDRFEQARRVTDYDTAYVYSAIETRRAAARFARTRSQASVAVPWYTLRTNRAQIRPCDHLYLVKDLYLQRSGAGAVTLEEQREFYTESGQLIATKREVLTHQLKRAGFYTASVPLPIPPRAPAGTYRVVTRLLARAGEGTEQVVAQTSAEFRVLP